MKFGIIGAMEEEIEILKHRMKEMKVQTIGKTEFLSGKLANEEVVLVKSGIGKVNASITVMQLVTHHHVDYIINTGSAGSLDSELKIGDLVIADALTYHDVDVTSFGYAIGQMAGMPEAYYPELSLIRTAQTVARQLGIEAVLGQIVSGDQFVSDADKKATIKHNFPEAKACEMEATAIAHTCYNLSIPFLIIRAISDQADGDASLTFDEFIKVAGKAAAELVEQTIQVF